jgi:hypothetical protein
MYAKYAWKYNFVELASNLGLTQNYEKTNRIPLLLSKLRVSVSPWEKDAFAQRLVRVGHEVIRCTQAV